MKFIKEMFQKFHRAQGVDNRGLTLVELLCSVAILGVISLTVSAVLVVSADSYDRSNSEIKVQQEAQLVANQIDDLLIDATADVEFDAANKVLTIKQGTVTHTVEQKGDELYYSKDGAEQLMASGVKTFDVNTTEFAEKGYLKLNMDLERKSQTYPAVFTITARNKDSKEATKVVAAIHLPNQITLEPNQSYGLDATISGLADSNLTWEIVGASDPNTSVSGSGLNATVKVGKDEIKASFKVKVTSPEKAANGIDPKAQKMVTVLVRRVNILNVNGSIASGTQCKKDAKYSLTALIQGTSLQQVAGAAYDTDYVNPYQVSWSVIEGSTYATVAAHTDTKTATLTLTEDIPLGAKVTVQATALHPEGTLLPGDVKTNKTDMKYGTVVGTFTIKAAEKYVPPADGGWMRQSSQRQADINVSGMKAAAGGDINDGRTIEVLYRYAVHTDDNQPHSSYVWLTSMDAANLSTHTGWETWAINKYGDANGSGALNLRPLMTGLLEYDKDYYIEAIVVVKGKDAEGKETIIFPKAEEFTVDWLDGTYGVRGVMRRVGITYKDGLLNPQPVNGVYPSSNTEATAPTLSVYQHNQFVLMDMASIVGIDTVGTSVDNDINYILEKKQPDGTWKDVTNKDNCEVQNGRTCRVTLRDSNYHGSYRVKVYIQNMPNNKWDSNTNTIVKGNPEKIPYILYDETSGNGIFYFNV